MTRHLYDWGVVIVTAGRAPWNAALWDWCRDNLWGKSLAVSIVTGPEREADALRAYICPAKDDADTFAQVSVVSVAGAFSYPLWANLGAGAIPAAHYLFLHDDMTLPNAETDWLAALRDALHIPLVGLAVPRIVGDAPGAAQTARYAGMGTGMGSSPLISHTTDYISGACVAVRAETFRAAGGFSPYLSGCDWQAIDLQRKLARAGLHAAVVPSVTVGHTGAATWGTGAAADRARRENRKRFCELNHIPSEYGCRPTEVRVTEGPVDHTLGVLVDTRAGFVLRARRAARKVNELVVIDTSGTGAVWNAFRRFQRSPEARGYKRCLYALPTVTDLARQLADLSAGAYLSVLDARGDKNDLSGTSRRVRLGHRHGLLAGERELHMAFLFGVGLGDLFMMTPTFAALRRAYPRLKQIVYARPGFGEVLDGNPDLFRVELRDTPEGLPIETAHFSWGVGSEGTIRNFPCSFGVEAAVAQDRRLRYVYRPVERDAAIAALRAAGASPSGQRVVAVQWHGNWATKQWGRTRALIERLIAEPDTFVLAFSTYPNRREILPAHARLWQVGTADGEERMPIREVVALLALCDAFVGFDSGLTFAAMAGGCPVVGLFGPHDPLGYAGDVNSGAARRFLRPVTPSDCQRLYGVSCRTGDGYGEWCPFRKNDDPPVGGDCIDAISVEDVYNELARLPTWDGAPLAERLTDADIRRTADHWSDARPQGRGLLVPAHARIGSRAALVQMQSGLLVL